MRVFFYLRILPGEFLYFFELFHLETSHAVYFSHHLFLIQDLLLDLCPATSTSAVVFAFLPTTDIDIVGRSYRL